MCDSILRGRVDLFQSQFMDRVSLKFATQLKLQSHPCISTTPNSWRFLQRDQHFPLLSYISPLPDICQFYVRGLGTPAIVLQDENDVNFPAVPWLWDVDGKAADNSCKDANTSHHLQNYFPAIQLFQLYPWELQSGEKKEWCHPSNVALNLS